MTTATQPHAWTLDLSPEEYHAEAEHDSNTWLRCFERSPGEYYHRRITHRIPDEPPTEAQRLGSAIHACILQPDQLAKLVAVIPPWALSKSGSRSGKQWDEWRAEHNGAVCVKLAEYDAIQWAVASVWANPACKAALESCTAFEHSIFWNSPEGYKLRGRLDAVDELGAVVLDVKRTRHTEATFWRSVREYSYHCQAALYCDLFRELYGVQPGFQFLIVCDAPPYDCALRTLPREAIQLGREQNADTLAKLHACKRGERPWLREGQTEVRELDLPPWFFPLSHDY